MRKKHAVGKGEERKNERETEANRQIHFPIFLGANQVSIL